MKLKIFLLSIIFGVGLILPSKVLAATLYVNYSTGNDTTGSGSAEMPYKTFYKGYTMASAGDTLNLTGTFDWSNADETGDASDTGYTLTKNLTLQGQSAATTIIQAASSYNTAGRRVFTINTGVTIANSKITVRYGKNSSYGGGIYLSGTLNMDKSAVSYNVSGDSGGGIEVADGTLNLTNSTINNNQAVYQGGGIHTGYYSSGTGTANITNSTIAYNSITYTVATIGGGGVAFRGSGGTITNSTIAYNNIAVGTAGGSGIWYYPRIDTGLIIKNSIISGNLRGGSPLTTWYYDVYKGSGTLTDNGYNIVGSNSNTHMNLNSTSWVDAAEGASLDGTFTRASGGSGSLYLDSALADNSTLNGTQTLAITNGAGISVNNGSTSANGGISIPSFDQRAAGRNGSTDIGAYEYGGVLSFDQPTTQASEITFSSVSYGQMTIGWTSGNGSYRAVFVKQANSGTATPVDATTYTANTAFGSGTQIGTSGWYCVYNSTGTSVTVTGLNPSTDYIAQVFEYNGGPGYENYNPNTGTNNPKVQATTAINRPTVQTYNLTFSSVQYAQMTVGWTNGNGEKRVVFAKAASSGTAVPIDNTTYTANTAFGSGTQISSSGWYAIYNSTGTSVTVTGLTAGTSYIFQVFEYNGSAGIETYFTDSATDNPKVQATATVSEPSSQATNLTFSSVAYTSMIVGWSNGNGENRIVFAKQANTGTATPVDNTNYTASATFGSGTQISSSGWYAVYKGTGTSVAVTGLTAATDYIFQVFEYNSSGSTYNYNPNTGTNNPLSQATAIVTQPTTQATAVTFSSITNVQMTVSWTNGNGEKRAVFIKQANTGTATPVDDTGYTANTAFGSGTQIGSTGWYCVYNSTGTSVTVTGLTSATDYMVQVFEYNESGSTRNYLPDTGTNNPKSQTTAAAPSTVTIGSGTSTTGSSEGAPVNIWYRSLHGQSVYTRTELNTAGATGPVYITQVGFYIASVPSYSLPNFIIRMKHTSDADVTNWQSATGMTTVYSTASYTPVAGDFQMLTLSTPFTWNGTDNLVVDTAFSLTTWYAQTGTVRYYSSTNGYRTAKSDSSDQTNVFTGGSTSSSKPQLKLSLQTIDSTAPTITSVSSDKANGNYKAGEIIDIDVTFSEAVTSTGNVTVTLNTGQTCTFTVTNSSTGTCNYTVQSGDTSADLDATISGTIADQSSNQLSNFTPATSLAINKNLVIDTTAPEAPTATPAAGTYTSTQSVLLSSSGSSAIYYTTDSSDPTTGSTLYSGAIVISLSSTIKALAVDSAGNESVVLTANYIISAPATSEIVLTTSSTHSAPGCADQKPVGAPDLFQIDTGSDFATLYFTPIKPVSEYVVSFNEHSGTFKSTQTDGVVKITINFLIPNSQYTFKVRAGNGCATGDWSNSKTIVTTVTPARQFIIGHDPPKACVYTVLPNDTLWTIAQNLLGDGSLYPKILKKNPDLATPLKVGTVLALPCEEEITQRYSLAVKVMVNNQALPNIKVNLGDLTAVTNESGIARFPDLDKNDYLIKVAYQGQVLEQKITLSENSYVVLTFDQKKSSWPVWIFLPATGIMLAGIFVFQKIPIRTRKRFLRRWWTIIASRLSQS